MYNVPFVRTQADLLAEVREYLRDSASAKWTDKELYRAMNMALAEWGQRVSYQRVYSISGGFSDATFEYTLPGYISGNIIVQVKESGALDWANVLGFRVHVDAAFGSTLTLDDPQTGSGRIIYRAYNGPIPVVPLTLLGNFTGGTDTSILMNNLSLYPIARVGYFGFSGTAIYEYAGTSDDSLGKAVRLSNVTTTPFFGHNESASTTETMYFCIAAPDASVFNQLIYQTLSNAHGMFLTNAPAQETEHHQWQMQWWGQKATEFWRGRIPQVSPSLNPPHPAIGRRRELDYLGVYP